MKILDEEFEDSEEFQEKFKLLALTVACKKVAEKNYLTLVLLK